MRLALVWLLAAAFQQPFKIVDNVNLVLLDVSVKDQRGAYVTDLPKDAFRISVDGKQQELTHFSRVDSPVTIGLIVDNSGSMRAKRNDVVMAGLAFAKESNPQDEFFVVNFNNAVRPGLPFNTPFTDQIQLLHKALFMGVCEGQTALYDAVAYGLKHLEEGHRENRTLIVVSDGGDNVSKLKQTDILNLIEESRATIYAIGLLDPEDRDLKPAVLKKFASISGGEYYQPAKLDDVIQVLATISKDLRSRYSVGFSPVEGNGKSIHQIKASALRAGESLSVRTRNSYREPQETP